MNNTPYFNFEEIEAIINNPKELTSYFEKTNFNENGAMLSISSPMASEDQEYEEYEDDEEEYGEEEASEENDVESMSDKEKIKLAYEILSMTAYEDEFFMGILGRLRKLMRG
jgi:hypothetical protein